MARFCLSFALRLYTQARLRCSQSRSYKSLSHPPRSTCLNILLLTRYHRRRTFLTHLVSIFYSDRDLRGSCCFEDSYFTTPKRVALPFLRQSLHLTVYSQGKPISKLKIQVTSQHYYSTLRLLKEQAACFRLGNLVTTFRFPSIFQSFASD
jgi:hypothetical protein